ncbi:helix-turn-helix domain-containing protein [Ktedonobacteria bacterium brp13]|nr:helix-turn-helix domain-containing protein [Ktedonobacteria bacterium brp13]
MRAGPLGQRLTAIADYAERYAYQGDIRVELQSVIMTLFADMIQQHTFRYPQKFHQTPLGSLFSQAALRFFRQERPAGRLIKVAEARQICNVSRQIIHEWAADGLLWPMYDEHGTLWLDRAEVERWQQKRALSQG